MAVIESWFMQERTQPVKVRYLDGNVFSMDNNGNLIGIEVLDNGEPASLSGSVSASVIRADGATVQVAGSISGNKCSVILPQACYAIPGAISIVIKLTSESDVATIGAVVGVVYQSSTDSMVDPGQIMPSIETLIATIQAAVASVPADYSALSSEVDELSNRMDAYALLNLFSNFTYQQVTDQGVIYSITDGILDVHGQSTTNSTYTFFLGDFPAFLEHDKDYYIEFGDNPNIKLQVFGYASSSSTSANTIFDGYGPGVIKFPTGTSEYIRMRVVVSNYTTVNETIYPYLSGTRTNAELDKIVNKYISPDMFSGSDGSKIQQAFAFFGNNGQGTIIIDRDYTLDRDIYIDHQTYYDINNRITVIGMGKHAKITMGGYEFRGRATGGARNYGGITFKDINFTGANWLFRYTNLIRITMDNCAIENFKNIIYGTTILQSYYFINCLIRDISEEIIKIYTESDSSIYDVNFSNCMIERCVKICDTYRVYNMVFSGNCIEGFHNLPFKFRGYANNIVIENNYFEANNSGEWSGDTDNGGLNIDMTGLSDAQSVSIMHNFFAQENSTGIILLPDTNNQNCGTIAIQNNTHPWVGTFIKASSQIALPYADVLLSGNRGEIYDPNYTLFPQDKPRAKTITDSGNSLSMKRIGNVIELNAADVNVTADNGWTDVFTDIDSGFVPPQITSFMANSSTSIFPARVTTSGSIQIYLEGTSAHVVTFHAVYTA